MKKRFLSGLLSIVMVLTMLVIPMSASADTTVTTWENVFEHDFDNQTVAPLILSNNGADGSGLYSVIEGDTNGNSTKYGQFASAYDDGAGGNHRKGWKLDETLTTGKIAVEFDFKRENNDQPGYVYLSNAGGGDILVLTFFKTDGKVGAFANNTDVTGYSADAMELNTWYSYRAEIDLDTRKFEAWITNKSDNTEYAHINTTAPAYSAWNVGWLQNGDFGAVGAMKDICVDNISVDKQVQTALPEGAIFVHDFDNQTDAPVILSNNGADGSNAYGVINGDANGNSTKYGQFASTYNDGANGWHRKGWKFDEKLTTGKITVEFDFSRESNDNKGLVYLSNENGGDLLVLTFFNNDGTVGAFADNTIVTGYSKDAIETNTWYSYKAEIDLDTRAFEAWITKTSDNSEYAHINSIVPEYSSTYSGWLANNDFAAIGAMLNVNVDNISVTQNTDDSTDDDEIIIPEGAIFVHDFDHQTDAPLILSNNGADGSKVYGVINGDANGNSTKYGRFDASDYNDGATGNHRKGWKFDETLSTGKITVEFDFKREDNNEVGYVYLSNAGGNDILVLTFFDKDGKVGAFANNKDVTGYSKDALALNTWYSYKAEIDLDTRAFEAWITNKSDNTEYAHINTTAPTYNAWNVGWLQNNDFAAFGAMKDICVDNISVVEGIDDSTGGDTGEDDVVIPEGTIFANDFDAQTVAPVLLSNNGADGSKAYGVINGDENGNSTKYGQFASTYDDGASGWHRKGWTFNKLSSGKIALEFDFKRESNDKKGYVYLSNTAGNDLLVLTFFNDDGTVGAFANNTNVTKYSKDAIELNSWYNYRAEIDLDTRAFEAWITNKGDSSEYAHINSIVPESSDMYSGWIANNDITAFGAMLDVCMDNIKIEWNYDAPQVTDSTVAIRNVLGEVQTDMKLVDPNVTAIDIDFGTPMNEDSLDGAITLTKTSVTPPAVVECKGELIGSVYTINFAPLAPFATYELKVSKDVAGLFGATMEEDYVLTFKTAEGRLSGIINSVKSGDTEAGETLADGNITVDVDVVNTSGVNKTAVVYLAYYGGGELLHLEKADIPVDDGAAVRKDDINFTISRPTGTDTVKILLWEDIIIPLCKNKKYN